MRWTTVRESAQLARVTARVGAKDEANHAAGKGEGTPERLEQRKPGERGAHIIRASLGVPAAGELCTANWLSPDSVLKSARAPRVPVLLTLCIDLC